jgi:hypothetical protein
MTDPAVVLETVIRCASVRNKNGEIREVVVKAKVTGGGTFVDVEFVSDDHYESFTTVARASEAGIKGALSQLRDNGFEIVSVGLEEP